MLVRDPIYYQLNSLLRDLIRGGEFTPGSQFLSERQVAERFGVSRATANKAVSNLVSEGVLEFRKGVGTFVRGGLLDYDLRSLVSFTEKARVAGKAPETRVLRLETLPAVEVPTDIVETLRLPEGETAYYLERLRLADGLPVILERRYLVARYCPGLTGEAVAGSLYAALTETFGLDVTGADETIRAVNLADEDAALLQTEPGSAGLLVTAVGLLSGDAPLWHERTLYRGDAYEFHNRLGPVTRARPAAGQLIRKVEGEVSRP